MLKRFRVQGFRTCHDVTLDNLGHVTALIGQNGSGKTNLLRAVEDFARFTCSKDAPLEHFSDATSPLAIEADINLNGCVYHYSGQLIRRFPGSIHIVPISETLEINDDNGRRVLVERSGETVSVIGHSVIASIGEVCCLSALDALLPHTDAFKREHLQLLLSFFRSIRYYPLDEPNDLSGSFLTITAENFISEAEYQNWVSGVDTHPLSRDSAVYLLLHAYKNAPSRLEDVKSLLGPAGLQLIDDIKVLSQDLISEQVYIVYFMPSVHLRGGRPLTFHQLSQGTRRIIRLVSSLVIDDTAVMLVEHPEDGIHRGLVKKLIDLISSYANPKQVILSTHSTTVMNALQPADIRLVTIEDGSTQVRPLSPKEVALAENYINEEGSLAEFIETVEG